MDYDQAFPPMHSDPSEAARIEHTRLRRRMLLGMWMEDALARLRRALPNVRADAVGQPDLSANPFAAVCAGVSALYDRDPQVGHEDATAEAAMREVVRMAGLYPLMQRVQRDTIGMREMLVRPDARIDPVTEQASVAYTSVPPDMVEVTPDPNRPGWPCAVRHWIRRQHPVSKKLVWTRDVWDVSDQASPVHKVLDADGTDSSHLYGLPVGGLVGEAYPYIRTDGRAVLPYVVYHAALTSNLWDTYFGREVVEGTLDICVLWTMHGHVLRDASWMQRWIMGAEVAGASVEGPPGSPRLQAVADHATILELQANPDFQGQAQVGQFAMPTDPLAFAESVVIRERRLVAYAGLAKADVLRESGDPRGGYALAVNREGQRESQRRYAPVFRPSDEELLSLTAVMLNRARGVESLPEDGWTVVHQALPPSKEEREAERGDVLALIGAGLISKVEARMRLLGESRAEAEEAIGLIAETTI